MKKNLLRILIADIDQVLADALSSFVQEALGDKYELNFVFKSRGDQIFNLTDGEKFDIFILTLNNIVFPLENISPERRLKRSLDLVAHLKSEYQKPIITLCGLMDDPDLKTKAIRAGADFYFQLPVRRSEFKSAVLECLNIVPQIGAKQD